MKGTAKRRRAARTVLVVGEGDAEEYFLRHLKTLYLKRGGGVAVTIKNARGKGAAHVVDVARRLSQNADYDVRAALLDTDTDWNDRTRSSARRAKVEVFPAEPCLEALLLAIHRQPVQDRLTIQLKQEFAARFGGAAAQITVFERHFTIEVINEARLRVPLLHRLLNLLEAGQI